MLDHHIQRSLVYKLALSSGLRFSELKPTDIENKLFDYHLKKVLQAGYVAKQEDGSYALTSEGRRLGVHVLDNVQALVDRAYSVLFLVIRRKTDGAWLLYKRKAHPLMGKIGFMHATPNSSELVTEIAHNICKEKTGLDCEFTPLGSGYFRVFNQGQLESFTHFTLLVCEDAQGELRQEDSLAEYTWFEAIDPEEKNLLPNMPTLLDLYQAQKPFFVDKIIHL